MKDIKKSPTFDLINDPTELLNLKGLLKPLFPRSGQILNIIELKLQGRFTDETRVDVYLYNDGVDIDAEPFVVILQQPNIWTRYGVFVLIPLEPTVEMISAFESFVNWKKTPTFCSVNQSFFTKHLQVLCKKHNSLQSEIGLPCESNILDPELALSCPDLSDASKKIELRSLSLSDVPKIVENYPYGQDHSGRQIELAVEHLASCGLYVDGVLATWAILSPVGLINILHTDEPYRRRGLALLVMKSLSKTIAGMGLTPIAENEPWNDASRNTLVKAGFKIVGFTNWVYWVKP